MDYCRARANKLTYQFGILAIIRLISTYHASKSTCCLVFYLNGKAACAFSLNVDRRFYICIKSIYGPSIFFVINIGVIIDSYEKQSGD